MEGKSMLNELRDEIYDDAVKHGLWEFRENYAWLDELDEMTEEDKKDYCVDNCRRDW